MTQDLNKKTGATPIVEEGIGGGELLGALPVKTLLVRFRDGHGQESVKLAALVPGGEIYFFDHKAVDSRPVQTWLKKAIVNATKE